LRELHSKEWVIAGNDCGQVKADPTSAFLRSGLDFYAAWRAHSVTIFGFQIGFL
jgi:hypothetical protein